ncbi:hypothetical protein SMALA_4941 [Streptomyces malaysiensis subsp. malaysiensis]|nr:hypothetical protein SMALA_4941 [Streptomyces malaysiensis]
MIGRPRPIPSVIRPRARVSLIAAAHFVSVLLVSGATRIASGPAGRPASMAAVLPHRVAGQLRQGLDLAFGILAEPSVRGRREDHVHVPVRRLGGADRYVEAVGGRGIAGERYRVRVGAGAVHSDQQVRASGSRKSQCPTGAGPPRVSRSWGGTGLLRGPLPLL